MRFALIALWPWPADNRLVKPVQDAQKPIRRKLFRDAAQEFGNLGLVNAESLSEPELGHVPRGLAGLVLNEAGVR